MDLSFDGLATVLRWIGMAVVLAAVAFVVARMLGGTSRNVRLAVFRIIMVVGLILLTSIELGMFR